MDRPNLTTEGSNLTMAQQLARAASAFEKQRTGHLPRSVTVVLSGDEEHSGEPLALARRDLVDAADWADLAIGFEDGDGDPRHVVISRRGAGDWVVAGKITTPDTAMGFPSKPVDAYKTRYATAPAGAPDIGSERRRSPGRALSGPGAT